MASSRRCGLVDGRSRVIALFLPRIQYVVLSVEGWPSAPALSDSRAAVVASPGHDALGPKRPRFISAAYVRALGAPSAVVHVLARAREVLLSCPGGGSPGL